MLNVLAEPRPATTYRGERVALLTQHGKERVLGPLFRDELGARVELVGGYDTDQLGTFTREVPRAGSQLEAARKKALLAIELSGLPLAIASEGAFTPGPLGLGCWNDELVVLVDRSRGLEIVGRSSAPGHHTHAIVADLEELHEAARRAEFPEHALVLRPDREDDPRCRKGIRSWRDLDREFLAVRDESATGKVFVENDLRAHVHPSRMVNIAAAARDLLSRVRTPCPACGAPGFGLVKTLAGLPCRECDAPTSQARADEHGCVACAYREVRARADVSAAEPFHCSDCNP